jgi:hypothetical protein
MEDGRISLRLEDGSIVVTFVSTLAKCTRLARRAEEAARARKGAATLFLPHISSWCASTRHTCRLAPAGPGVFS